MGANSGGESGGGGPVTQTGSMIEYDSIGTGNTGTVTTTLTVPADAELAVVGISGYASANFYSSGSMTLTKGGSDSAMTAVSGGDASTSAFMAAMFYIVLPDTGSNKTLKWDWAGAGASSNQPQVTITFWKDVDTSSPVRNAQGAQNASGLPFTTPTITAVSGDLIIAYAGWFGTSSTIDSWTNLTLLTQCAGENTGNGDGAWATGAPSGNTTVEATTGTGVNDGGICAISVKPAP